MASKFNGKRAFVTGGSKGIGAAIVRALCEQDSDVVFAARDVASSEVLADESGATPCILDLLDIENTINEVNRAGPFDILINNAGIDQHSFFTLTTPEDWHYLLRVNLEAVFATTLAALPEMQENGFGRIINISSEAGRGGSRGGSVYAAAKGGVHAFTKSIARENSTFGITANVVAPGPIDTPLLRSAIDNGGGDKLLDAMKGATLMRRLGTPEEVASLVVYLASEEAGFITGEVIGVSGGMGIG